MRSFVFGIACALLCTDASIAAETKPAPILLTIAQGTLSGTHEDDIAVFKNIPFAAPPTGPLRWRTPQQAPSWTGTRAADTFGPACPQKTMTMTQRMTRPKLPESEDCLTLNVWTPKLGAGAKLPVMVWIYGGAFVEGGSALPIYDGTDLAKHGVVIVTVNYRLGWLGFFDHPALAAENPGESRGNYGLMDQIAALEWVKHNISSFGGDPSNVTIFGESAGGMSVNDLLVSPRAHGLFAKAIAESGLGMTATPTKAAAQAAATDFGVRHGAKGNDASVLAKLRALSVADIITDQDLPASSSVMAPMIDGDILPDETDKLFAAGKIAPVPYIAGSNSNESTLMMEIHSSSDDMLKPLGNQLATVRKIYDPSGTITDDQLGREIFGDVLFASAAQGLADYVVKEGEPAYVYRFGYLSGAQLKMGQTGVGHGGEVPYIFGLRGLLSDPIYALYVKAATPGDLAIVSQMQYYWTNFAKTGNPNGADLPTWTSTSPAGTKTLLIDNDGTKTVDAFRQAQLAIVYIYWSKRTGLPPPN